VATPPRVVTRCRWCLCVAPPAGVYDVAGVAILGLSVHVKDPLPDQCSALIGWLPRGAACVNRHLLALSAAVVPRAGLMVYVGH
jgi:hypothetical protein